MPTLRIYTDLDIEFKKHPGTADVRTVSGSTAVNRALKNLIRTRHYERPFHPELGSGVYNLLFEQITATTAIHSARMIQDLVRNFEPRVEIADVRVEPNHNDNELSITVEYYIANQRDPVTFTTSLRRLR